MIRLKVSSCLGILDEMSSEDSFLASSYDEVFVAKVDRSLNRAKLHKFRVMETKALVMLS